MLLSALVVLWQGLDWVLLASLDYNRSDAHFTNEQLSRHHTVFVPWIVLNTAQCQKFLLLWGSTSWSSDLLCIIALVNWRPTENRGGCNNGELNLSPLLVNLKWLYSCGVAWKLISAAVDLLRPFSPREFNMLPGSPALQCYNSCWTCHLLPVFICFCLNGMKSLLWAPSSNRLLDFFLLLCFHCRSSLNMSVGTRRVVAPCLTAHIYMLHISHWLKCVIFLVHIWSAWRVMLHFKPS